MPIIENNPYYARCDERFSGRSGTPYAMFGGRNYRRRFQIEVKLKEMSPMMVSLCPGVPLGGSPYIGTGGTEWDPYALLIRKTTTPQAEDDWQFWNVDCDYSTEIPSGQSRTTENTQNQPDQEKPDVRWSNESMMVAPMVDYLGRRFLNAALQPYVPAKEFPVWYSVLHISRNELSYTKARATEFAGALNDAPFLGHPAETVQCGPPEAGSKYRGSFGYWRASYKLSFAPKIPDPDWRPGDDFDEDGRVPQVYRPWQPTILNAGMYERIEDPLFVGPPGPGGIPKILAPIYVHGKRVAQPVPLNADGSHMKPDADGNLIPVWHQYAWFRKLSFKSLLVQGLGGPPP